MRGPAFASHACGESIVECRGLEAIIVPLHAYGELAGVAGRRRERVIMVVTVIVKADLEPVTQSHFGWARRTEGSSDSSESGRGTMVGDKGWSVKILRHNRIHDAIHACLFIFLLRKHKHGVSAWTQRWRGQSKNTSGI